MASIGTKIKAARKKAGLTQRALAKRAGVSNTMIYQIEKGTRKPGLKTLEKLSEALGVSFDALRGSKAKQKTSKAMLDDKLVYEIAQTVKPMTIREKEEVLSFVKYLRGRNREDFPC